MKIRWVMKTKKKKKVEKRGEKIENWKSSAMCIRVGKKKKRKKLTLKPFNLA